MCGRAICISDARVIGLFCPGLRRFGADHLSSDPDFIVTSNATMVFSKKEVFTLRLKVISQRYMIFCHPSSQ